MRAFVPCLLPVVSPRPFASLKIHLPPTAGDTERVRLPQETQHGVFLLLRVRRNKRGHRIQHSNRESVRVLPATRRGFRRPGEIAALYWGSCEMRLQLHIWEAV